MAFFISTHVYCKILNQSLDVKKWIEIKTQVSKMLIEKNKSGALRIINVHETLVADSGLNLEFYSIKESILTAFLNQETQDLYESATAGMIQNLRLSEKNSLKCLELDPENLFCQWQYLKILKFKNDPQFTKYADLFVVMSKNLPSMAILASTLYLNNFLQSVEQFNLQKINPTLFHILEFERALANKNYSFAKETLLRLSQIASDYPDLVHMRARLSELSAENSSGDSSRLLQSLYKKKCARLSSELTRKYFFDINLCHRGF